MRSLITQAFAQLPLWVLILPVVICGCYQAPTPPTFTNLEQPDLQSAIEFVEPEPSTLAPIDNARVDDRPAEQVSPPDQLLTEAAFDTNKEAWIAAEQLPWVADYVQYLNVRQIGFSHIEVLPAKVVTNQLHVLRTDWIDTLVDGQRSWVSVHLDAQEFNTGELIDLAITSTNQGVTTRTEGPLVNKEKLALKTVIESSTAPIKSNQTVAWKPGTWGTLGIQAMLLRQPMIQPGEQRKCKVFIPSLMEIASVELTAGPIELTPLVGGRTPELLPIEVIMRTETSGMRSRNWINERGEIEKTLALTGPNVTTYRVPRAITLRLESAIRMQALMDVSIPLTDELGEQLDITNELRDRTYSIKTEGRDLNFLLRCERQRVVSKVPREADVTIVRNLPTDADKDNELTSPTDAPTAADLESNTWLPADHPTIDNWASELLGELDAPDEIAARLARVISERIQLQPLDTRFASALETARNKVGDCVDQTILLTTLLRNRKIPARVRGGLRLDPAEGEFKFHLWTEAWIDNQWLSFDATDGELIGVQHIAIEHERLAEENPYSPILHVLEVLPSIVEVKILPTN